MDSGEAIYTLETALDFENEILKFISVTEALLGTLQTSVET